TSQVLAVDVCLFVAFS
ncbi:TPA: DUF645 family protein, partial [Vibrio cholerae]|nr:DUF645 family protein [Vibrio cholerae]